MLRILHALFEGLGNLAGREGTTRIEFVAGDVLNSNLVRLFRGLGMTLKQPDNSWVLVVPLPLARPR